MLHCCLLEGLIHNMQKQKNQQMGALLPRSMAAGGSRNGMSSGNFVRKYVPPKHKTRYCATTKTNLQIFNIKSKKIKQKKCQVSGTTEKKKKKERKEKNKKEKTEKNIFQNIFQNTYHRVNVKCSTFSENMLSASAHVLNTHKETAIKVIKKRERILRIRLTLGKNLTQPPRQTLSH